MKIQNCAALALLLAGSVASNAVAGIVSVSGSVEQVAAPSDVRPDQYTHETMIRVFAERQNVLLTSALTVNAVAPGLYNDWDDLSPSSIGAENYISSFYMMFDTPGMIVGEALGTVSFDQDILGVIVLGDAEEDPMQSLDPSDYLGSATTVYPDFEYRRGLEMFNDRFIISGDSRDFTLKSFVITPGDAVRIITRGQVPAPTGAAVLAGLGLLGLRRRRTN